MPVPSTADILLVRRMNKALLLNQLRLAEPRSRAELAKRTGLTRSTVSSIIAELIAEGFVRETELQKDRVGRPGMQLELNPLGGAAVGVEAGVDFISVRLADFIARPLWTARIPIVAGSSQEAYLSRAEALVSQALAAADQYGLQPLGIGLGVPGLVDLRRGELRFAPNLGWRNVPLREMWTARFSLPIFVENEANAAALGEYYFGVARQVEDFIYLSAGVGLGGGIVLGGKLFRGFSGYAGEIGHMTIDPHGEACACGKRGCWETLVGPRAVIRALKTRMEGSQAGLLHQWAGEDLERLTFEQVVAAGEAGDPVAKAALHKVGRSLGIGIANLVNAFNPQLVVLGGALSRASDLLFPVIRRSVAENSLPQPHDALCIAASAHGQDACTVGAVALVLDDILREPLRSPATSFNLST